MQAVLYIHGKGGSASESAHYQRFFPGQTVVGLAYQAETPREAGQEICAAAAALKKDHESVTLIANSIGAYFSMFGGADAWIDRAFFISPIVDMEQLICGLMAAEHVTEEALQARGVVPTAFGEPLSWEYLCRVRAHPICWNAPTAILYGGRDTLTDYETVASFAEKHGAALTVMEEGEHWFHTPAQMRFLDRWLRDCLFAVRPLEAAETDAALALAWRVYRIRVPGLCPGGHRGIPQSPARRRISLRAPVFRRVRRRPADRRNRRAAGSDAHLLFLRGRAVSPSRRRDKTVPVFAANLSRQNDHAQFLALRPAVL